MKKKTAYKNVDVLQLELQHCIKLDVLQLELQHCIKLDVLQLELQCCIKLSAHNVTISVNNFRVDIHNQIPLELRIRHV